MTNILYIFSTAKGEGVLDFFTSDDAYTFMVKIEGITDTGLPFSSTMKLNVFISDS